MAKHNICPCCTCPNDTKICSRCKQAKPLGEFRLKSDGFRMSMDYQCELAYQKEYQSAKRDFQAATGKVIKKRGRKPSNLPKLTKKEIAETKLALIQMSIDKMKDQA